MLMCLHVPMSTCCDRCMYGLLLHRILSIIWCTNRAINSCSSCMASAPLVSQTVLWPAAPNVRLIEQQILLYCGCDVLILLICLPILLRLRWFWGRIPRKRHVLTINLGFYLSSLLTKYFFRLKFNTI